MGFIGFPPMEADIMHLNGLEKIKLNTLLT